MHPVRLIERAPIHVAAQIRARGKCDPGTDPEHQQTKCSGDHCGQGKCERKGQYQLVRRIDAPDMHETHDDLKLEHALRRSQYPQERQHRSEAHGLRKRAEQYQNGE